MDDLIALIINHAVPAGVAFVGGVLLPAALLLARKKAKQTRNKIDDALVDAAIEATNKRER